MKWLQILLVLIITCWAALPVQAAEHTKTAPLVLPTPPTLVPCTSATNCNRNPKDLEAFVEQFYKWYEISYQFIRHQSSQELRHSLRTQRTNYLQNYVTPSLFYWHKHPNIEAPYNKNYCSPGADTFTCLQDFDLKWLENSDVKLKTTSGNIAQIQYVVNKEYELTVYLIVSQGSWKIYKIKSKF